MPYFQRSWHALLGEDQSPKSGKALRSIPITDEVSAMKVQETTVTPDELPQKRAITATVVLEFKNSLNKQVAELRNGIGAQPISSNKEKFAQYEIDKGKVIFKGVHSEIYRCNNAQFGNDSLMVRQFKPTSLLKSDSFYLKCLRQIGKIHFLFIISLILLTK